MNTVREWVRKPVPANIASTLDRLSDVYNKMHGLDDLPEEEPPRASTLAERLPRCIAFCEQRGFSTDIQSLAWQLGESEDAVRTAMESAGMEVSC